LPVVSVTLSLSHRVVPLVASLLRSIPGGLAGPEVTQRIFTTRTFGRRAADAPSNPADVSMVLRTVFVVIAVVGGLWVAYQLGTLIVLLLFSILFAYLLTPLVELVQRGLPRRTRRGELRRGVAIAIAYLVIVGGVALMLVWITPHVTDAARQLPQRLESVPIHEHPFRLFSKWLGFIGISGAFVDRSLSTASSAVEAGVERFAAAFVHLASYLPWLVLIPIFGFFFLKDAQTLTQSVIRVLPDRWQSHAPELLTRVDEALSAYIRAQLVASLIVGAIVGLVFTALRVPFAAVLAVAAGGAEFLPIVGPLAVAAVAAALALMRSPFTPLWVLLFLAGLRVVEDYVIYPRLVGSRMHLHPLAVILAVLAGGELGGVVGVLLSVPCLAIASAVSRYVSEARRQQQRVNRSA
jgi:predicted PurR-regulated permease PerM